ncbi:MAG: translocation/assembly module TamB domain-containing protein [Niabella sp.]
MNILFLHPKYGLLKKFKKILLIVVVSLVVLLAVAYLALQSPPVQTWLIGKVTDRLSHQLKTRVEIKGVDFSFFNKMHLLGVLIEDRQKDTILRAGEVTVNVNDWFFLKNRVELKYLGLKDAVIKLQRTDSVWRHQFLLDYFSTPASSSPKKQNAINLDIKDVDLQNIFFKKTDGWLGEDLTFSLGALRLNPDKVDIGKKQIALNSLAITKPYVALHSYEGNRPPRQKSPAVESGEITKDTSSALQWNPELWQVSAGKVTITDGTFKLDNTERAPYPEFDGQHILFSKINVGFKDVKWQADTISTYINLSTQERSGLEVRHLIANAKVTPKEMTFNNLDILTNRSQLKNYFSMKYEDFSDMSDFVTAVRLEGNFDEAKVNSDDIAFFAPALSSWKKEILLSGKITGPVAALNGKNLSLETANGQTQFAGNASLTGLPDINSTFISVEAEKFNTTYNDAVSFIPSLKTITTPDLKSLQYVRFKGNYNGFINDFVTYGTIQTALGTVVTDLNMKLPNVGTPGYSGSISTSHFDLGTLLDNKQFGFISTNTKLKGAGFETGRSSIAVESSIQYFDFNDYRYQDINVNGKLNKNLFDGILVIKDSNANLSVNGLVNFEKAPVFDFTADVVKLNLSKLKFLSQNDLSFSGKIKADFSGKNIDDFLGNARISEATLIKDGFPLSFDTLSLTSDFKDGQKHLNVASNELTANVTGQFSLMNLPNTITSFLSRYYPAYIKAPIGKIENQSFNFDIKTNNITEFIPLTDSLLSGFNNSHITGSINAAENKLQLNLDVPQFKYGQYTFDNVRIDGIGNYDSLLLNGRATDVQVGNNINIPLALFQISAKNDISHVSIFSGGGNNAVEQARLNATVQTFDNGVHVKFAPSTFIVNSKTWSLDDGGELELRKHMPVHGQLVLREGLQEILVKTIPSDIGSWNDIGITLSNINIGDFSPYFLPDNRLEGLLSANVLLENPGSKMRISSQDLSGRSIRFDNDSIGNISAKFYYDLINSELVVNGKTLNPQQKDLAFNVHLYLKDQETQAKNIISLDANRFDLKYLNRFLGFLFSDITGEITGKFDIKGPLNAISVVGKGKLSNAGLRVNFTQCYYKIEDREIALSENEINLDGIVLRDPVTNNPIYLKGNILHSSFDDMFFDLTVSTRKPGTRDNNNNRPVQVLNTTYKDNKLFYGNVKATGSFALLGPANDTYMKIDAIASSTDSSNFTIASSSSKAGEMPDWLVERKFGELMTDSLLKNTESNMTYELDVTATPMVQMKFVMDDLTGDEIKGRGSGTLNIKSGTSEPLAIRGRLDLDEGSYNYTFQSFFPRPFEIIKGNENYISWNGDPMDANINISAQYKAEKVSFAPLTSGTSLDQSYSSTRENVHVTANLSGKLFKPSFKFGIELDPMSNYKNDFNVSNALRQIEGNPNEITRQVTYLIVFNSFAPPESGTNNLGLGNAANELLFSSLSGILFSEINSKLNNELSKMLNTDNISVVFSGSVYNRNILTGGTNSNFGVNQSNFNVAVPISLFKDRFVISLGSSLDVPLQSSLQQNVQFLPDVTAEWLINTSGSIRLNFFYRENMDYLTTASSGAARTKRTGGGISFRREFNKISDLFQNKRKEAQNEMRRMPVSPVIHADSLPAKDSMLRNRKDTTGL